MTVNHKLTVAINVITSPQNHYLTESRKKSIFKSDKCDSYLYKTKL